MSCFYTELFQQMRWSETVEGKLIPADNKASLPQQVFVPAPSCYNRRQFYSSYFTKFLSELLFRLPPEAHSRDGAVGALQAGHCGCRS